MILQVGPCKVEFSSDMINFTEVIANAEVTVELSLDYISRVNDGMIVDTLCQTIGVSFTIDSPEWSKEVLESVLPLENGVEEETENWIFTINSLVGVETPSLRFTPLATGKAATVIIPKVRFTEGLPIPFAYAISNMSIKGIGVKDIENENAFIIINIPKSYL